MIKITKFKRFFKMSKFQEDMLFKNVNEYDAKIFLEILGKKSNKVKIITQEIRQLDPSTFVPDIILELDDEILLIELQSIKVGKKHHKRFHVYVALSDYKFDNIGKEINLCVFTTAEDSKIIKFKVNKYNDFKYEVISIKDYDAEKIINTMNYKIENNIELTSKELILFALVPIIEKDGIVDDYVEYVVNALLDLNDLAPSIKALVFGIEWLIVDKFVSDDLTRNILRDVLGERMSLIHEYGRDKERKGEDNLIRNMLKSGMRAEVIAKTAKVPLSRVKAIEKRLKSE
jgi:hypothetical protein